MRLAIARALAAACALGLAAGAAAQQERKTGYSNTVTVIDVRGTERSLLVREDAGGERLVYTDEGTRILDGSTVRPLESLETGQRVVVDASPERPDGSGRLVATRIVFVNEEPAPPAP